MRILVMISQFKSYSNMYESTIFMPLFDIDIDKEHKNSKNGFGF